MNTSDIRRARLAAFLDSMGRTPEEVAGFLRRHGCRGTHGATSCPVAVAITRKFRGSNALVGNTYVGAVGVSGVPIPEPVQAFIRGYDGESLARDLDKSATK